MKTISTTLSADISAEVTTLATCWKVTRRDGVILGFTDHDRDIVYGGQTYQAATGASPSAVSAGSDMKVDELDIEGILDSEAIAPEDIYDGKYDYAEVELFLVNYVSPGHGSLPLRTGWLGEVKLKGNKFVAEVRGLTQALQQPVGEIFSATCRADFGDSRCKISLGGQTYTGTIDAVNGLHGFYDAARTQDDGFFALGSVTFLSGVNDGVTVLVKEFSNSQFYFALPLRVAPAVGDAYSAVAGCDKLHTTCKTRFNNIVNFRGEPYVPGTDKLLETAATRSSWV